MWASGSYERWNEDRDEERERERERERVPHWPVTGLISSLPKQYAA